MARFTMRPADAYRLKYRSGAAERQTIEPSNDQSRVGRKHLPNVYFSLREASKHLPSRPKHLQPAPTVTRARPGGGPLPHSPGTPRPGQPLATYLGPRAARYAGISPVLARLNPLFRSKNPYQTLRISSKHLRQTLRFGPKHLPNTPQKVLRPTLPGLLLYITVTL